MTIAVSAAAPDPASLRALLARIEDDEGAPPLSDAALAAGTDGSRSATRDGDLVGFARVTDDALELAAEPDAVDPLLDAFPDVRLAWSHGEHSRLVDPLQRRGFHRERELLRMARPLAGLPPADPPLPSGVTVRAFVPGRDDDAWLSLNSAAFADHPEQGRWTHADLQARLAEPWFDAAGFLVAERDGRPLGFHWTKRHPHDVGEVYVLGVSPQAQGTGLGRALLARGLRHLSDGGARTAMLYVDGDNPGAVRLYERDGFVRTDLDVQWRR